MSALTPPRIAGGFLLVAWVATVLKAGIWKRHLALPDSSSWLDAFSLCAAAAASCFVFVAVAQMLFSTAHPWPSEGTLVIGSILAGALLLFMVPITALFATRAFRVMAAHEQIAKQDGALYRINAGSKVDYSISMYPLRAIVDFTDGTWLALSLYPTGRGSTGQLVLCGTRQHPGRYDYEARWMPGMNGDQDELTRIASTLYRERPEIAGWIGDAAVRGHRLIVSSKMFRTPKQARALLDFTRALDQQLKAAESS